MTQDFKKAVIIGAVIGFLIGTFVFSPYLTREQFSILSRGVPLYAKTKIIAFFSLAFAFLGLLIFAILKKRKK
jgi:hypothetical protein